MGSTSTRSSSLGIEIAAGLVDADAGATALLAVVVVIVLLVILLALYH